MKQLLIVGCAVLAAAGGNVAPALAQAAGCGNLMQFGVFDSSSDNVSFRDASHAMRVLLEESYSSWEEATAAATSVGISIPVEGIPIGMSAADARNSFSWSEWRDFLYEEEHRATFTEYVRQREATSISTAMTNLVAECLRSPGLKAWLSDLEAGRALLSLDFTPSGSLVAAHIDDIVIAAGTPLRALPTDFSVGPDGEGFILIQDDPDVPIAVTIDTDEGVEWLSPQVFNGRVSDFERETRQRLRSLEGFVAQVPVVSDEFEEGPTTSGNPVQDSDLGSTQDMWCFLTAVGGNLVDQTEMGEVVVEGGRWVLRAKQRPAGNYHVVARARCVEFPSGGYEPSA